MNMKTTLVLALVALVVVGVAFFVMQPEGTTTTAQGNGEENADKVVTDFESEDVAKVDRVEMETRTGGKMIFEKQGDDWMMLEPMSARAARYSLENILRRMTDLEYVDAYEKDDEGYPSEKQTGFGAPVARLAAYIDGDKKVDLVFGKTPLMGKGQYLRRGGEETVLVAGEDLTQTFRRKPQDFRDKQLIKRDLADVARVEVSGATNFHLARDGDDWILEEPVKMRADKSRADRVARKVVSLSVSDWIDDAPTSYALFGLDEPTLTVTAQLEREVPAEPKEDADAESDEPETTVETETLTLLVGGPTSNEGTAHFARFAGEDTPWVFSITDYDRKEISPPITELGDKSLIDIQPNRVTKIEATLPDGGMTLVKSEDGKWTFENEQGTADMVAVLDLMNAVNDLEAENFADPGDPLTQSDWDSPRAKIAITQEGRMKPATLLIGDTSASGKMVFVKNADEQGIAAVRDADVEEILLGPIAYRDRSIMRFPRERAERLNIARRGSDAVTLEKVSGQWKMVGPIEASADASAVRTLLLDLATLRAERVVDVGNREAYGLDDPDVEVTVTVAALTDDPNTEVAGEEQATEETPEGEGDEEGAETDGDAEASADDAPPGMSIEELLEFQKSLPETAENEDDIAQNPAATKMLEDLLAARESGDEEGGKKPVYTLEDLLEYTKNLPTESDDPDVILQNPLMIELLENMIAERDAKAAEESAEDKPEEKQASKPKVGKNQFRLALAQQEGKVYAALASNETIYEVGQAQLDNAMAELHDRQIAKFEVADVKEVIFADDGQVTLSRVDSSKWKALEDPVLPIDGQKVTEALNDFRDLKTHQYVAYDTDQLEAFGLASEDVSRVSVTLKDGTRTEILVSPKGPENDAGTNRYATVNGSNKVFLLTEEQAEKIDRSLSDFEEGVEEPSA